MTSVIEEIKELEKMTLPIASRNLRLLQRGWVDKPEVATQWNFQESSAPVLVLRNNFMTRNEADWGSTKNYQEERKSYLIPNLYLMPQHQDPKTRKF